MNYLGSVHNIGGDAVMILDMSLVLVLCVTENHHILDPLAYLILAHDAVVTGVSILVIFQHLLVNLFRILRIK